MGETDVDLRDGDDVIMLDPHDLNLPAGSKPGSAKSNRGNLSREPTLDKMKQPTPPVEEMEINVEQKAEELKNEGNVHYKKGEYRAAIDLYSQAIDLMPDMAAYYGNRAAAYIMINKYKEAVRDAKMCTSLDEKFTKGYMREAKAQLCLGDYNTAYRCLNKAKELEPHNTSIDVDVQNVNCVKQYKEGADLAYKQGDFRKAVYLLNKALSIATNCPQFTIYKAECLVLHGRYQEAQEIANDIVMKEPTNPDAIYVRGMCLYYMDNTEKAFQHFQRVLQYSPEHENARNFYKKAKALLGKKEQGNVAFKSAKWQEAYDLYSEALAIDPNNKSINAALYYNRATTAAKLNDPHKSIEDCSKAIELDDGYLKAYLRRAKTYLDIENYDSAVHDYEKVCKLDKSREHAQMLKDAKLELKKSKRKDYYKLLDISKNADEDDIKKSYKKQALKFHPDRFPNATEAEKAEAERKFKDVGEAYGVLSDPKKKSRYDQGMDLEEINSGGGMGGGGGDIDPNVLFQAFFGGGGGGNPFGGGGGGGRSSQRSQMPGGFQFSFG